MTLGTVPILLLAGGQSRRMGDRDKLLEPVDGVPLLRKLAMAALSTGHPVIVALPTDRPERQEALEGLSLAMHLFPDAAEGMGGTMRAAIAALPPCPRFLLLLADLAEIEAEDIATLLHAPSEHPGRKIWRGATEDNRPGHPILFDASLRREFAGLKGDSGGEPIAKRHAAETVLVPLPGNRARSDLDTPEEWAAWRARTGR